jgi:hypothetical protein
LNLAPLILAKVTRWTPASSDGTEAGAGWSSRPTLILLILATALVAVGIAVWVYRASHWSTADITKTAEPPGSLPPFEQFQVRASVGESLKKFTEDDQGDT